jgi:site-specific DNA-cytosine methylase
MMLQQRYPHFLLTSAIHGYQHYLPSNVTLMGATNLAMIGPIDLLISGWSCQGFSQASMGQGFSIPD